jgi:DNA helicase HerA-like ATPase
LVAESAVNQGIASEGCDIISCLGSGVLVVADMTDPLLSSEEANGIFQVLTEKFRTAHIPDGCGKLLALDEAHKFMKGDKSDGLSNSIINAARLMRHDGMRVAISTQSPLTLAPELLELVSIVVLHRFHSHDWFQYLKSKIPLNDRYMQEIIHLSPGTGLMFAARHKIAVVGEENIMKILVRPRITADRGASRKNEKK